MGIFEDLRAGFENIGKAIEGTGITSGRIKAEDLIKGKITADFIPPTFGAGGGKMYTPARYEPIKWVEELKKQGIVDQNHYTFVREVFDNDYLFNLAPLLNKREVLKEFESILAQHIRTFTSMTLNSYDYDTLFTEKVEHDEFEEFGSINLVRSGEFWEMTCTLLDQDGDNWYLETIGTFYVHSENRYFRMFDRKAQATHLLIIYVCDMIMQYINGEKLYSTKGIKQAMNNETVHADGNFKRRKDNKFGEFDSILTMNEKVPALIGKKLKPKQLAVSPQKSGVMFQVKDGDVTVFMTELVDDEGNQTTWYRFFVKSSKEFSLARGKEVIDSRRLTHQVLIEILYEEFYLTPVDLLPKDTAGIDAVIAEYLRPHYTI